MLLNQKIAQKLVDNIMNNLGYNINIMNQSGVIIASGSKSRIGTYHKIAEEVIRQNKRIDIYKGQESIYKGVKQGINMPFYYNNQLAGVIGITGDPKEIENTVEIVRMATELMLEQEFLKERIYSHQNQKTFFINKLLTVDSNEEILSTMQWGMKLGYDLNIPRVICLLSIKNLTDLTHKNPLFTKEKIKEYILDFIKSSNYHSKQDISSYINVDEIIIFKTIKETSKETVKNEVQKYVESICDKMNKKLDVKWLIGVGTYHVSLCGLKKSYNEAKTMLQYANAVNKCNEIVFTENYIFEYLFSNISKEQLNHFLKKFADKIENKPEMLETIESLIKNDMNLIKTSKDLFVHRNTIIFRMNKLKELFHIDPIHKESDRLLLHLIYLYLKY